MNLILVSPTGRTEVLYNVRQAMPGVSVSGVTVYFHDTTSKFFPGYSIHAVIG